MSQRLVRLRWKNKITHANRRNALAAVAIYYPDATDAGTHIKFKAPKQDTKYLWIFLLRNVWSEIE